MLNLGIPQQGGSNSKIRDESQKENKMKQETQNKKTKKMSVEQGKKTALLMSKMGSVDLTPSEIFEGMVQEGLISNGRGCYTEGQEYFNNKYNDFKNKTLQEMKKLGLECKNSKGQIVDICLNHKGVK